MAKRVQLIRHTSGTADTFVGLEGEVTVDLTNDQLRVHDGITSGGMPQARQDLSTTQAATNSNDGKMTAALVTLLESLDALTAVHETRLDTIEANILPGGTVALFMQAAAPTGWTLNTTHNNKALRIVNTAGGGSGGAESFTTIFNNGTTKSTNSFALTTAELPAHTHNINLNTNSTGDHSHTTAINRYTGSGASTPGFGGGTNGVFSATEYYASNTVGLHAHNVSGATASEGVGGGHSHTLTMNLQYVDIIACSKDAF